MAQKEEIIDEVERAEKPAANHDPFTGTHTHAHPAFGSQGEDDTHEHEHTHDNDADHKHSHKEGAASEDRSAFPDHAHLYAPITRIDAQKREVEGIATSEAVDSFGTVFSYEASKKAFQNWIERVANVREMHERKAVGKGVGVFFDDDAKQVIVRSRVSKGAQDTWEKVLDGVLSGYSVGASKPIWDKIERNGKMYPYLIGYELTELSLVDNASNPDGQALSICRVNELSDLVDITEPEQDILPALSPPSDLERVGARLSAETRTNLHGVRDHQIQGAMKTMQACGCDDCQKMHGVIDPDNDGDNDLTSGPADTDHDAEQLANRVMELIETRLQAPLLRMQAIAGTLARLPEPVVLEPIAAQPFDITPLQQSLDAIVERLNAVPNQTSLDEVRASLEAVKGQVERIAAQPVAGGPVLSSAADPRFGAIQTPSEDEQELRILERLKGQGKLATHELQTAAAARAIRPWQS